MTPALLLQSGLCGWRVPRRDAVAAVTLTTVRVARVLCSGLCPALDCIRVHPQGDTSLPRQQGRQTMVQRGLSCSQRGRGPSPVHVPEAPSSSSARWVHTSEPTIRAMEQTLDGCAPAPCPRELGHSLATVVRWVLRGGGPPTQTPSGTFLRTPVPRRLEFLWSVWTSLEDMVPARPRCQQPCDPGLQAQPSVAGAPGALPFASGPPQRWWLPRGWGLGGGITLPPRLRLCVPGAFPRSSAHTASVFRFPVRKEEAGVQPGAFG